MTKVTRRRLLSSAAAGAGGVLASSMLPPALARAAAEGPRRGSLRDVKHVVIHMQENRSFDHYFGTLAGVAGFGDPNALVQTDPAAPLNQVQGKSIFYQYDQYNPDGYLLPWHLDTKSTSSQAIPSTSHAWTYQHESLNITVPTTPGAPTTALNNNWIPSHYTADGAAHYWYVMGYYERQDIPFHFALAETFTLCDHYHCSLLGPTWPNRMYLWSGTIDPTGAGGGPITSNVVPSPVTGKPYTWKTYPERLTEAGISWRVYQEEDDYGTNMLEFFAAYQNARPGDPLYEGGLTIHPPDRFEWDAKHGKLPTVSWIVPTSGQSEHPAYLPASGANYLASKLNAVAENRDLWSKTVFIVNYDENDGLFDHVVPPMPPAGTPDEFVQISGQPNWPIGGGVRVPCFIVSPWTVGGFVASEQFDHTSTLQLLERLTGVQETNISAWRRQTFGDLTSALGFSNGKATTHPPHLPATIGEFWEAEKEVESLPAATIPGAAQTPPLQEKRRLGVPWPPQSRQRREHAAGRALPGTTSRYVENRTTHRADFKHGGSDKVYLKKIAAVENQDVVANPGTTFAYVPGIVGGNVAILNTATRTLVSAITSGTTNPYGVAATPDGSQVWVTESGTNTVSVIPTQGSAPNKISGTVVVGIYPHGIAITPDGKTAYVANTGPNTGPGGSETVSVIDVSTQSVTATIDVGEAPQVVTISPDGSLVFVTYADGVYVITVTSGSVSKVHERLRNPHGVSVTPDGTYAYVTDTEHDAVVVISTSSLRSIGRITVGTTPWNTAFSADGSSAYVTNANDNTVSVIDTASRRVTTTIPLGSGTTTDAEATFTQINQVPTAVSLGPDGKIWVACNASSSLVVIDPASNAAITSIDIGLGDEPTGIAFA
ncbi:MAG TPA: alkaline phosphatase family protein [Solirubrobacteraceae bacterium]|nr:alkaline phosphatase family protein [Solirubrobacteraceae bacterium]